ALVRSPGTAPTDSSTLSLHDALPIYALAILAEKAAADMAVDVLALDTIPAHDAVRLAPFTPSIVIAVPSIGGMCHTPLERTDPRSEEHTSELQSRENLVCRLLLEKKK